jgi:hypothetical protein
MDTDKNRREFRFVHPCSSVLVFFEKIFQPEPRDLFDFGERGFPFFFGSVFHARLHGGENGGAVVEPRADDKWKTKTRLVGLVPLLKCGQFLAFMRSRPALACSRVDSSVSCPATASRPARSGCARIKASCRFAVAARIVLQSSACRCTAPRNGRRGQVSSATHGECSKRCPSVAVKAARSVLFSFSNDKDIGQSVGSRGAAGKRGA